ncbi:MAG: hypothetical protein K6T94_22405 [Paenibacillus sp.]|nr:hypothetical protein [Paenibacillus sp.]
MAKEQKERAEIQRRKEESRKKIYWPPYIFASFIFTIVIAVVVTFTNQSPENKALYEHTKEIRQTQLEYEREQNKLDTTKEILNDYEDLIMDTQIGH